MPSQYYTRLGALIDQSAYIVEVHQIRLQATASLELGDVWYLWGTVMMSRRSQ